MPKIEAQISSLEERLKQLKLRSQRMEARSKAVESRRERKADTRRKILIGSVVLAKIQQGVFKEAVLKDWLAGALDRPDDRALFGL